jgi:hypothetical protein
MWRKERLMQLFVLKKTYSLYMIVICTKKSLSLYIIDWFVYNVSVYNWLICLFVWKSNLRPGRGTNLRLRFVPADSRESTLAYALHMEEYYSLHLWMMHGMHWTLCVHAYIHTYRHACMHACIHAAPLSGGKTLTVITTWNPNLRGIPKTIY